MSKKNHKGVHGGDLATVAGVGPAVSHAAGATPAQPHAAITITREDYHAQLHLLQLELIKLQPHRREHRLPVHAGCITAKGLAR